MVDVFFWRQFFILFSALLNDCAAGVVLAFPSVLGPSITDVDSADIIHTTPDHVSWITSISGVGGLVGAFIMGPILQIFGRKPFHYTVNISYLTGFLILPFAEDIHALYTARFIQGICVGGVYIKGFMISEYVHPCRRGYFITLKKAATAFGVLFCHTMGFYFTWRQISIITAGPLVVSIIMTYFWPESPSYMALKGKYAECEKSFTWLNGTSEESRKQLKSLIEAQRERQKHRDYSCLGIAKVFMKKDFLKPFIITTVLTLGINLCGRYYYNVYIIEIMNELLGNKSFALYCTISADLLTLIAVSAATVIVRYVKRRTILFTSGTTSALLMLLICLMTYLKSIYTFSAPVLWLTGMLLIVQSFVNNIGLIPVSFAMISELFPLEHKGLGGVTSAFTYSLIYATVLKIAPILMDNAKLYGTFGFFSIALFTCLLLLYNIVPETKDKTLQQIEDELKELTNKDIVVERKNMLEIRTEDTNTRIAYVCL